LIQWFSFNLFGYNSHKKSVDILNFFLLQILKILGTKVTFKYIAPLPKDCSLIFVCNHQSTYDVSPIIWEFRNFHPKFIAKKELGKGIPSISYNLRKGGSLLIDRKGSKEALTLIKKFGINLELKKWSGVIFPEGTRSNDGVMRKFHSGGLSAFIESMPSSKIIPISINNSWKLAKHNYFPLPLGVDIQITVHKPIKISDVDPKTIINKIEKIIINSVHFN